MDSAAEPAFEDGEVAASFAALRAAAQTAVAAVRRHLTARDLLVVEQEWEQLHRTIGAAQLDNLTAIDTTQAHRIDGHRSVENHTAHVLKISSEEAGRRTRAARALRALPQVAEALRSGRIGLCHARLLAGVHANPRIRRQVIERQEKFLRWADEESFDDFRAKVLDWERATDMNGGFKDNERNHENRNVRLVNNSIERTWDLSGQFAADQGARLREILDHFTDVEIKADWAEARSRLGDAATVADLKRTDAQRRADALERIFNDAAGAPSDTSRPAIVHNIVWSADAYLALADLLGADAAALDTHWSATLTDPEAQRAQWCNPDTYRCSTLDGVPLEPVEQFFSSLANEVRRVIVNTKGVVIDLGRKARLFTGSARLAAQLQHPHCIWPGCHIPTTRCEVDHLHDYGKGGHTNPGNGAPLCGFHNRWKQKGFATTRDPVSGRWRTYRPDGSVIR
ncbi:MAG: HNH endonuclease signature motif containing protein [Acidimicrobiales bacterium]